MNEINQRWARDNRILKRLTGYGFVLGVILWPVSYYASFPAAREGQGVWFAWVALLTFAGAAISTVGVAIGCGIALTDEPPMPGDNR
jgi:hypothetical protein